MGATLVHTALQLHLADALLLTGLHPTALRARLGRSRNKGAASRLGGGVNSQTCGGWARARGVSV